jgi:hypothetical protein
MSTASTTTTAPLFNVLKWTTGKRWKAISPPLGRDAALDLAAKLKAEGTSGFHLRIQPAGAARMEVCNERR